jgi:hypothetical protein
MAYDDYTYVEPTPTGPTAAERIRLAQLAEQQRLAQLAAQQQAARAPAPTPTPAYLPASLSSVPYTDAAYYNSLNPFAGFDPGGDTDS